MINKSSPFECRHSKMLMICVNSFLSNEVELKFVWGTKTQFSIWRGGEGGGGRRIMGGSRGFQGEINRESVVANREDKWEAIEN